MPGTLLLNRIGQPGPWKEVGQMSPDCRLKGATLIPDPMPQSCWCFRHTAHGGNARPHGNSQEQPVPPNKWAAEMQDFVAPTWICIRGLWLRLIYNWKVIKVYSFLFTTWVPVFERQMKGFTKHMIMGVCLVTSDLLLSSQSFEFYISNHWMSQSRTHRTVWLY